VTNIGSLVLDVCRWTIRSSYLEERWRRAEYTGLTQAVRDRDTPYLFAWFVEVLSPAVRGLHGEPVGRRTRPDTRSRRRQRCRALIGWLLDTNVIAEIISPGGSARVKIWAADQDEVTLHLSILTIGEYEKGIANLPDDDPRRASFTTLRDSLIARFAERLLPVSDPIVRRWGLISGHVRRQTDHPPPVIDTLLAATAIEHDLYLATLNVRDVRGSGAALFNPWKDVPAGSPIMQRRARRRSSAD